MLRLGLDVVRGRVGSGGTTDRKERSRCTETKSQSRSSRNVGLRQARLRSLWQLAPSERVAAMRRGELTLEQCAPWAARYPEQMPLINREFEYLAAFTPEVRG